MRKIIKFGLGILAVMVVLAGLWTYHTPERYEGFYRSVYSYRVTIETDSVLHNATLYLPLPVFAGESEIGDKIVAERGSQPDDWNYSIVETEHGMMLAISMGELIPEFRSLPVPINHKTEESGTGGMLHSEILLWGRVGMIGCNRILCQSMRSNEYDLLCAFAWCKRSKT